MTVICRDVRKYRKKRLVLSDLNCKFSTGLTHVVGGNGAGKTSLMRLLSTSEVADFGFVGPSSADDVGDLKRQVIRSYRRELGWLPQDFTCPKSSTLLEYLQYVAWLKEIPRNTRRDCIGSALQLVGLDDRKTDRIGTLSGGMIRRLGLAQAILNTPRVLLLDEPGVGLDDFQTQVMYGQIRHLISSNNSTVIWATHQFVDVVENPAELLILADGKKIFEGSVTSLLDARGLSTESLTTASFSGAVKALSPGISEFGGEQ